ncbi:MAG: ABC transporter permease [Rhodocyclaceae bacterium]|nr:ABC transporter permease [Rhodocyclaceae bacterium]
MRAIMRLAALSAWSRRSTLALMFASIALSSALLLAVERIRVDTRESFTQSVSGVDLVVGPRSSAVQLVLHAIFHAAGATHTMRWESFTEIAAHPATAWAVPLALGDSHHGFAVLGTSGDYFTHYRYSDRRALRFAEGRAFAGTFEAVLGHEVATRLGYRSGERITLAHGLGGDGALAQTHDDKPFTVVGILAATGTPLDRTVHVSLESITALHLDWAGGAPLPGFSIAPDQVGKFDLQPREISAVLVGLKQRTDVFRSQRFINEFRKEPLMAVLPGVALDELWQTLGVLERTLLAVAALVVLIGLAGLAATLLAGLGERRRELAILRALGAGPRDILLLLVSEGLLVTAGGALAGLALLTAIAGSAAPWLLDRFGIVLGAGLPSGDELALLAAIVATGVAASLLPGWRAWRMSLADGLTPKL